MEGEQDNLWAGSDPHRRTPGSGTARGKYLQTAERLQTVGEAAKDAACKPCKWKDLTSMGVAGELEADARLFDDGQPIGYVIEQNARSAGNTVQAFQNGTQPHGGAGVAIVDAKDVESIDGNQFIGQDANANAGEAFLVEGHVAKLIVVSG